MVRFSLRIPPNTYAALKKRAKVADRSVNYVIVQLLSDVVAGDWMSEDFNDDDEDELMVLRKTISSDSADDGWRALCPCGWRSGPFPHSVEARAEGNMHHFFAHRRDEDDDAQYEDDDARP